jgi:hypothetical protein
MDKSQVNDVSMSTTNMVMGSPGQKVKAGMVPYKNIKDRGQPLYMGKTF